MDTHDEDVGQVRPVEADQAHPLQPLLDECRLALGRAQSYQLWLEQHRSVLLDIYRWALEHDPALLSALRRRAATR